MIGVQKLLAVIEKMEGFDKEGTIPRRRNNPGDLRHSPHSSHEGIGPNDIGIIDTLEHGEEDAIRQFLLDAHRGQTMLQFIYTYAPPNENNSVIYLNFVCSEMGCKTFDLLETVIEKEFPDGIS